MSDEIEDALRRELQSQWVPFDEARAEDMVRAAAETGLAGTPRAWVAPLAAAAAVVVIGGGVALSTAGGGGNSDAAGPGGPAVDSSSGNNNPYVTGPCEPLGSGDAGAVTVYPATAVPDSLGALGSGMYTAYPEGSSTADAPPPVNATGTATPAHFPPSSSVTASYAPADHLSGVPAPPTVSYVPMNSDSNGTPEVGRSDTVYICSVGPATTLGADGCTTRRNAELCVGSVDCPPSESASSSVTAQGPGPDVVCIATEAQGTDLPLPTEAPSGEPVTPTSCPANADCANSSSSGAGFSIDTKVAPGSTKTFDGPAIPAGQVLVVDSVTFLNPAADQGTITLDGDAPHRLSQNLADIHKLDFHLDTEPFTYEAGHPVRVTVDCANSAEACTPSVSVTGHFATVRH